MKVTKECGVIDELLLWRMHMPGAPGPLLPAAIYKAPAVGECSPRPPRPCGKGPCACALTKQQQQQKTTTDKVYWTFWTMDRKLLHAMLVSCLYGLDQGAEPPDPDRPIPSTFIYGPSTTLHMARPRLRAGDAHRAPSSPTKALDGLPQ